MADILAPPAKRTRYNLRSLARSGVNVTDGTNETSETNDRKRKKRTNKKTEPAASNQPDTMKSNHSAYLLRSNGKINEIDVPSMDSLPWKLEKATLVTLNPDCLLKLCEFMNVVDLCNMAETCTTLSNYAKYHFRLKYKNFDFVSLFDGKKLNVDIAERVLSTFGDQIHTLKISRDLFEGDYYEVPLDLFRSTAENCKNIVKVLTLERFNLSEVMKFGCTPALFNSLESLTLRICSMYYLKWCNMNKLKVLKLKEIDSDVVCFHEVTFNKLEEVELNCVDFDWRIITELIRSKSTIKRLSIVKCFHMRTSIFSTIKDLANLEEFEFQSNRPNPSDELHCRDLNYLMSLKKLKVLKLSCSKKSVHQLIDGFCKDKIQLEYLELADGQFDAATLAAIVKLKTIKVLKFNDMINFTEHSLYQIAKELNQLEELHIQTSATISQFRIKETIRQANRLTCLKIHATDFSFNTDTYRAALAAVQKRSDQNHLAITIYGDGQPRILVPQSELAGPNEKWLKVNQLNRDLFPTILTEDDFDMDSDEEDFDEEDFNGFDNFDVDDNDIGALLSDSDEDNFVNVSSDEE